MTEPISEKIIIAYFEKRATPHERLLIKEWLKDNQNEELFYEYLARWEAGHLQFVPDEQTAFLNYKRFLDDGHDEGNMTRLVRARVRVKRSTKTFRWMAIAASVILVACASALLLRNAFLIDTHTTSFGMTKNVILPDGTEVTLNANSELRAPKDIATNALREVWLDGEAFFAVAKRPNHVRFIVHTSNLDVEVLGTKFNVNNRRGKTEVVLSEGSVKLVPRDESSTPVIMKSGDYVSLADRDKVFQKKSVEPDNFTAWQTNKLIFEETPLQFVFEKIEDYYGVDIEILNKDVEDQLLTGTLPNNDLGIVLRSLQASHNLKIERNENRIIIE